MKQSNVEIQSYKKLGWPPPPSYECCLQGLCGYNPIEGIAVDLFLVDMFSRLGLGEYFDS